MLAESLGFQIVPWDEEGGSGAGERFHEDRSFSSSGDAKPYERKLSTPQNKEHSSECQAWKTTALRCVAAASLSLCSSHLPLLLRHCNALLACADANSVSYTHLTLPTKRIV